MAFKAESLPAKVELVGLDAICQAMLLLGFDDLERDPVTHAVVEMDFTDGPHVLVKARIDKLSKDTSNTACQTQVT